MTKITNIFRYSEKMRYFWSSLLVSLNIILTILILFIIGNASVAEVIFILAYVAISIYLILDLKYTKVLLNNYDIRYLHIIGIDVIKWSDLEDIQLSPRLICITSKIDSKKIKISRGEYGFSLEPFDELQEEILKRAKNYLEPKWEDLKFPLEYVFPGVTFGTVFAYLIPIGIIITFCVMISATIDGYLAEKLIFLIVNALLITPFIIRDYRRSCRTIILNEGGIQQINGKLLGCPWKDIYDIIVKEPLLGYGSITILGKDNISIWIPRYLRNAGQILYLIKKMTKISESYDFER